MGANTATIDSVYPLTEARAAFARLLDSGKSGKVVLRVREETASN